MEEAKTCLLCKKINTENCPTKVRLVLGKDFDPDKYKEAVCGAYSPKANQRIVRDAINFKG